MRWIEPAQGARLLAYGVALGFALPLLAWLDAPVHRPQDEGMLLVYPELIARGLLPHRDFFAIYPPGNFLLLSALYEGFGPSIATERLTGFAYRVALVLGIVAYASRARDSSALVAGICGVTAALVLQPLRLEAFSWVGGVALLVWGAVALLAARPRLAGGLFGLALCFRADLVLAIAMLVAVEHWTSKGSREAAAPNGPTGVTIPTGHILVGLALPLAPMLAFLLIALPAGQVFQDLFVSPVLETGPARRLPLSSLGTNSTRLLILILVSTAVAVAAGVRRIRAPEERREPLIVAALCVGLLPQAFQRLDPDHLVYAGSVAASLLPLSLVALLGSERRAAALMFAALTLAATILGPFGALMRASIDHMRDRPPSAWIHRNDRRLPARSQHELAAFSVVGTVLDARMTAGERLFIGPTDLSRTNYSDLHLFHLFPELEPASYYLELNPRSANRPGTRLTRDLETADWLLLSGEWDLWEEQNASTEPGDSRPNAVVRRSFELVSQHGVWKLYRRNQSAPGS